MSYETNIQSLLYNNATIQSLVTSYIYSSTTYYMIFNTRLIPKKLITDTDPDYEPKVTDKTINHYNASPVAGGKPIILTTQIIACRAFDEENAKAIRDAVFDALNRIRSADHKSSFVCTKSSVIPPANDTDNYNAQVEVTVRSST